MHRLSPHDIPATKHALTFLYLFSSAYPQELTTVVTYFLILQH
ncbi:hypothetical protein LPIBR_20033 [Lacticaseibacillus paracasei]|nr:hypothetical protein LPIBR_20033 [Lacticaseibacillus paracasei]